MSAAITLIQVNSVYNDPDTGAPVYRCDNDVTAAEGISRALFVFKVADDLYSHVAADYDLLTYPDNKADALADGLNFYRQSTVVRDHTALADATVFATHVQTRLQRLSQSFPQVQDEFVGITTYTFPVSE